MYEIHFRRHVDNPKDYALIATARTIEEAKQKRSVSGDLVVSSFTHKVIPSFVWLFEWELENSNSYAKNAILRGL